MIRVWMADYQLQCCGETFAVGSRVSWTLDAEADLAWMAAMFGDDLPGRVTHAEDHHGWLPDDAPETTGLVTRVRAASCRYGPPRDAVGADARVHVPMPGTGVLVDVRRAEAWPRERDGLRFFGYVIDLEPEEPAD